MSRNLMLCVWLCVTAGCMTTGGTGGTPPTPTPAEQCPAEPRLPPPPALPEPTRVAELTRVPRENLSHIVVFLCPERMRLEAVGVNLSAYTLPFWIRGEGSEELSRFFTEANRLGVPIITYTGRIPVRRPVGVPPPVAPPTGGGTSNATDTESCTACEINGAGQTTTTAGSGGGGGGRPPDWVIHYLEEVAIRTAHNLTLETLGEIQFQAAHE